MIFTSCGKMGDLFQCLPIFSAYYAKTGEKVNLALAQFPYRKEMEPLLKMQECIGEIYYTDYSPKMMISNNEVLWDLYKFNPYDYGLVTESVQPFINIGFRHFPDKNYTQFLAEEHGLDIDWGFKLNIGEKSNKYRGKTVVCDKYAGNPMRNAKVPGEYLLERTPLIKNLQYAAGASCIRTYATGSAILLLLAGKSCIVYGDKDLGYLHMNLVYDKLPGKAIWKNI